MANSERNNLILSVFPGIDLLGRAFEEAGWCVVRGPDLLWGGDVKGFHPSSGVFEGVIGGPPCQCHSAFLAVNKKKGNKIAKDLIPEFLRVVEEARPTWFLMENVPRATIPEIECYDVFSHLINNRWLGEIQNRKRRFSVGFAREFSNRYYESISEFDWGKKIQWGFDNPEWQSCVRGRGWIKLGMEGKRGCQLGKHLGFRSEKQLRKVLPLMGFPEDFFDHSPFRMEAKWLVLGNGVPLAMGRAVAGAIRKVLDNLDER